ncbi:MAG: aminopeptidase [Candidatus Bathyarchaeia archaeon]
MPEPPQLVSQIVDTCLNVKAGENVWVQTWDHTVDLASEIALACRQRGAHPTVTLTSEDFWLRSLTETPKEQLETLPSSQSAMLGQTDAFVFMLGPKTPVDWSKIPREKQELADVWYLGSNRYMDQWRKKAKERSVRTLGIEYCLVTQERAQALGLNWQDWKAAMLAGCLVNQREIAANCERFARRFREGHEVSVRTSFGTRLDFNLAGRDAVEGDSIVSRQDAAQGVVKFLPSGFVEVAPDEGSLEGTAVFDAPILIKGRERIEGLVLEFKHGKVTEHSAERGIEAFKDYLKSSQGDLDKFAFFGVGLNPGLRHGFTQDDKVLGGVTIGVGGNEDKGGKNRTLNNRHWWASMTKATVQVDGALLFRDGCVINP